MYTLLHISLMIILSPMLIGIINRVKAKLAGRSGQRLAQPYFDLWKLLHKGAAISRTTTFIFAMGPAVSLSAVFVAAFVIPCGTIPAVLSFSGDFILFAYLLALGRFFTMLAALDTGSSFEGMGASREALISAIAEIPLLLALLALAHASGGASLSNFLGAGGSAIFSGRAPIAMLAAAALFIVMLAENSRIPIDDPTTHLELTMIHEVMVLDHGGMDLAFITWGAAIKLWLFGSLISGILFPCDGFSPLLMIATRVAGIFAICLVIGLVESGVARLKMVRVPHLLTGAGALAALALMLSL